MISKSQENIFRKSVNFFQLDLWQPCVSVFKIVLRYIQTIKHFAGNLRGVYTKRQVSGAKQRLKAQEAKLKKNGVQEQPEVSNFKEIKL